MLPSLQDDLQDWSATVSSSLRRISLRGLRYIDMEESFTLDYLQKFKQLSRIVLCNSDEIGDSPRALSLELPFPSLSPEKRPTIFEEYPLCEISDNDSSFKENLPRDCVISSIVPSPLRFEFHQPLPVERLMQANERIQSVPAHLSECSLEFIVWPQLGFDAKAPKTIIFKKPQQQANGTEINGALESFICDTHFLNSLRRCFDGLECFMESQAKVQPLHIAENHSPLISFEHSVSEPLVTRYRIIEGTNYFKELSSFPAMCETIKAFKTHIFTKNVQNHPKTLASAPESTFLVSEPKEILTSSGCEPKKQKVHVVVNDAALQSMDLILSLKSAEIELIERDFDTCVLPMIINDQEERLIVTQLSSLNDAFIELIEGMLEKYSLKMCIVLQNDESISKEVLMILSKILVSNRPRLRIGYFEGYAGLATVIRSDSRGQILETAPSAHERFLCVLDPGHMNVVKAQHLLFKHGDLAGIVKSELASRGKTDATQEEAGFQ